MDENLHCTLHVVLFLYRGVQKSRVRETRTMAHYTTNGTATVRYDRLIDLGHDINSIWLERRAKLMNEIVQICLTGSLFVTAGIAMCRTDLKVRPYLFHIGTRFCFASPLTLDETDLHSPPHFRDPQRIVLVRPRKRINLTL